MAINQFFNQFSRIRQLFESKNIGNSKIFNLNIFIYLISLFIFVIIFILITDLINKKNKEKNQNLSSLVESNDFLNLTDHIITKINNELL